MTSPEIYLHLMYAPGLLYIFHLYMVDDPWLIRAHFVFVAAVIGAFIVYEDTFHFLLAMFNLGVWMFCHYTED